MTNIPKTICLSSLFMSFYTIGDGPVRMYLSNGSSRRCTPEELKMAIIINDLLDKNLKLVEEQEFLEKELLETKVLADIKSNVKLPDGTIGKAVYGFCPICNKPGIQRERRFDGNDTCPLGHTYSSASSLKEPKL